MGLPLIYRRSPFVYPGGRNPGFDPTHIAAAGISNGHGFSGIAQGKTFRSLLSGAVGGAPFGGTNINGVIGPNAVATGSSNGITFGGQSTANDASATMAVIVFPTALSTNVNWFGTSYNYDGGGWTFGYNYADNQISLAANNNAYGALLSGADIPYFLAASSNGSKQTFVALNLLTGQITPAKTSVSMTPTTPGGGYWVGGGGPAPGGWAAAMFAPTFMSLPALLQWARAPWDFWYPRTVESLMFSGLGNVAGVALWPFKASTAKTVFATSGSTITLPVDWTGGNTIICIGEAGVASEAGGGGGAYSSATNISGLTPGGVYNIQIGTGGSGNDTWFESATTVQAKAGNTSSGGAASSCYGGVGGGVLNPGAPFAYSGGNAASGFSGGGGAGGPFGIGGTGSAATGNGGSGDFGRGGVGGLDGTNPGGNGAEYTATVGGTAGSGGGGGQGGGSTGGAGGLYGGGGGGSFSGSSPGTPAPGVIILRYTPA